MPDYYDTWEQLNEYLVFHYGSDEDILKWEFGPKDALGFHQRLVNCVDFDLLPENARALDLGCSVGRISFELARHVDSVIGIDFSSQFVAAAKSVQESGEVAFYLKREGDLSDKVNRVFGEGIDLHKVSFIQGDAENLSDAIGTFDVLVLANILDRLPHPRECLRKLAHYVNPGGQMVICSPFTWWDAFTERNERLGGYVQNGKEITSLDSLKQALETEFELIEVQEQPFLIREHERKYHFSVAETTRWVKKQ